MNEIENLKKEIEELKDQMRELNEKFEKHVKSKRHLSLSDKSTLNMYKPIG